MEGGGLKLATKISFRKQLLLMKIYYSVVNLPVRTSGTFWISLMPAKLLKLLKLSLGFPIMDTLICQTGVVIS